MKITEHLDLLKKNMIKIIKLLFIFYILILTSACSKVRESAGVTRKSIDEFQVVENPPLVIPPDFNLVSPDLMQQKNIENVETELAQEILFGLESQKEIDEKQLSTMTQILSKANASNISNSIRDEIDQDFAQEKATEDIFQMKWEKEVDVLDAVAESKRIRNTIFNNQSFAEGETPIKKEKIKLKKRKRFIFF